jgi:hypothetical protein
MKLYPRRALAGASALAIAGGLALAGAGSALAAGPAPWEPDPNAQGQVTFTDANGVPITGGNLSDSPLANFALGSTSGRTGDTKAVLFYYLPVKGVNSLSWNGGQVDGLTVYNPGSALPANLASTALPVNTDTSGTVSVGTMVSTFPNDSTGPNTDTTWQNQYEVRLKTNGTSGTNTNYDAADILVNPSAGTWQLEPFPAQTVQTTTTLTPSPANPDITSVNPAPVTLTTKVTPAGSLPSGFTGSPGVVQIKNGATIVATVSIAPGAVAPYTITTNLSLANPSTENWVATFFPDNGSALLGSASPATPYQVEMPADATAITLGVVAGLHAGDNVAYSGTVTDTTTPATPVNAGTVNLFDNGSAAPLNAAPLPVSATGAYSFSNTFASAGAHSIVAVYSGVSGRFLGATSTPATFSQSPTPGNPCDPAVGGQCTDVQTITGKIPTGILSISTPYTANTPLDLGTLALDPTDTYFTAHATFGKSATDPTQDILITDTRAGNLPWTAQAQAANLSDSGGNPGSTISGENVGLTGLSAVVVTGNGFVTTGNLVGADNPAATPPVLPTDPGFAGLGNEAHKFAQATHGLGSVGIIGTLTLNAPSSTEAGQFTGTVTFTLVGSIVANAH